MRGPIPVPRTSAPSPLAGTWGAHRNAAGSSCPEIEHPASFVACCGMLLPLSGGSFMIPPEPSRHSGEGRNPAVSSVAPFDPSTSSGEPSSGWRRCYGRDDGTDCEGVGPSQSVVKASHLWAKGPRSVFG